MTAAPSMVTTTSASPVGASASTLDDTDLVPPRHAATPSLVVVGPVAPMSANAPGSPSSLTSLPLVAAPVGLVMQTPLAISEDELYSLPKLDDERLSPEVLLHIAYEVVSRLDRVEEFCLLSPDEQDLHYFLKDHIASLQLVLEVQDAAVPSMAQESLTLVQIRDEHYSKLE
jgi:hypothetical protein